MLSGWLNTKMLSHQYRNSHCEDKKVSQLSYLYNGNSYTLKEGFFLLKQGPDCYRRVMDFSLQNKLARLQNNVLVIIIKVLSYF